MSQREELARVFCYWDAGGTCHDAFCVGKCTAKTPEARFFEMADLYMPTWAREGLSKSLAIFARHNTKG